MCVSAFDFITGICTVVGTSQLGVSQIFVDKACWTWLLQNVYEGPRVFKLEVISASVDRGESKKF